MLRAEIVVWVNDDLVLDGSIRVSEELERVARLCLFREHKRYAASEMLRAHVWFGVDCDHFIDF